MLDFCLADSMILYFWYVLESIHKFIIELHALQGLPVRRCNKKQRRCSITSNFTKGDIFSSIMTTKCSWGYLTMWILFLDPPRKAFFSPSVWSGSIVCIGVSTPPQKLPPPLSWQDPLKSANCPSHPFYAIPSLYWFYVKSPSESQVFRWMPKY